MGWQNPKKMLWNPLQDGDTEKQIMKSTMVTAGTYLLKQLQNLVLLTKTVQPILAQDEVYSGFMVM
jgi:hypothetical protein